MSEAFKTVSWALDSNIYEVNLRQYTSEGSFRAFADHLPGLRDMGIEILWFMPITPISHQRRLGSLGSYYACSDYTSTNPEFGTIDDFRLLVKQCHDLGFKVIIDWVANHTGWDHRWTVEHPEFYRRNLEGQLYDAHGWADVVDLNFDLPELRTAMIEGMRFWVETCDIDGFRCDMAMLVPIDFWKEARTKLDGIRPLFWLAECEEIAYHEVFDVTYTWKWLHDMEAYWKKATGVHGLMQLLAFYREQFPENALRAFFTSNHDENSHSGTEYERMGDAAIPFAVFCCLYDGLPLIYSGQELPNHKRLLFFDKDQIDWKQPYALFDFYKTLLHLRKNHGALRAGDIIGRPAFVNNNIPDCIFSFIRKKGDDEVLVVLNLSAYEQSVLLQDEAVAGSYRDVFSATGHFISGQPVYLRPWDYKVYIK